SPKPQPAEPAPESHHVRADARERLREAAPRKAAASAAVPQFPGRDCRGRFPSIHPVHSKVKPPARQDARPALLQIVLCAKFYVGETDRCCPRDCQKVPPRGACWALPVGGRIEWRPLTTAPAGPSAPRLAIVASTPAIGFSGLSRREEIGNGRRTVQAGAHDRPKEKNRQAVPKEGRR